MIVVDASALIEVLLRTARAPGIEAVLFAPGETLHAPQLLDLEVIQVMRRFVAGGALDTPRARAALRDMVDFPLERYPHDLFVERIWALRANLTAYDAAYVALAEALGARLVTCDARLAAAPGLAATVSTF